MKVATRQMRSVVLKMSHFGARRFWKFLSFSESYGFTGQGTENPVVREPSSYGYPYLVGGDWNHGILWLSHHIGNVIIPTDEVIFFRGVGLNHQVAMAIHIPPVRWETSWSYELRSLVFTILNGFMSANTLRCMAGYVYCRYIWLVMLVLCLERYVWCTDMLLDFNRASKIQQRPLGYYYTSPQRVSWRNQSFWKMPTPFAMIWDARLRCKFHGLFDEGSGYILR